MAPTSITECARHYHAAAAALATLFGLPLTAAFVQAYHSAISSVYIEAGRAGVRLAAGVQLPPLAQANGQPDVSHTGTGHTNTGEPEAGEIMCSGRPPAPEEPPVSATIVAPPPVSGNHHGEPVADGATIVAPNGDTPPLSVITTVAELPTRIPAGLQLPCAEALIRDLRPPQLSLLIGKVGLRALAEKSLEPLHVALLTERARRFEGGQKPTPEANGHGA